MQVPQPSQATVFDSHGQPACDLERLLSCVTPVLMLGDKLAVGEEGKQAARLVGPPAFKLCRKSASAKSVCSA